jgi:hypothetical protein
VASFRSIFKGIDTESFVLLARFLQIATKFTKRAFLKLLGFYQGQCASQQADIEELAYM